MVKGNPRNPRALNPNYDDSTVYARIQTNTQAKGPNANSPFWYPYGENCILCELPETERGNRHILVMSYYFTKWTEAFALQDLEGKTVASTINNGASNCKVWCAFGDSFRSVPM